MGRFCEILFFVAFVKASPQDEHGVERPALSQGCGGGVAPAFLQSPHHHVILLFPRFHHPFHRFYLFYPFCLFCPFYPLKIPYAGLSLFRKFWRFFAC